MLSNQELVKPLLCLPRMKRGLERNEREDGGGPSRGCQKTLKRSRKQKSVKDEGARWESLPQEILLHIFQYLPLLDRAYASQVLV